MYKLLLCWRYLRTRYLALACIISVMLGVATLIVVNAVMGGFSTKLRERLHSLLSDVVIEAGDLDGFPNPGWHMKKIMDDPVLRDKIVAMTPTMEIYAMLNFRLRSGQSITRAVRLVGIDPRTRSQLGGFKDHLVRQKDAATPSFAPSEDAIKRYFANNPLALGLPPEPAAVPFPAAPAPFPAPAILGPPANPKAGDMESLPPPKAHLQEQTPQPTVPGGTEIELPKKAHLGLPIETDNPLSPSKLPEIPPLPPTPPKSPESPISSPPLPPAPPVWSGLPDAPPGVPLDKLPPSAPVAANGKLPPPTPWMRPPQAPEGIIVGYLLAHARKPANEPGQPPEDYPLLHPGDEVTITTLHGGMLAPAYDHFLVVDYFKSEMSEYDSSYVFVPLEHLQQLRGMQDRVTSIQIRLKDYDKDGEFVKERLREIFNSAYYRIDTWEGRQGALLAAIQIERGILNVLLFLIIAVAGFGILAIFSMIVTEKTRDIGILKALGASHQGVMSIFLSYGLLLGLVGAGLGTLAGVALTENINQVQTWLSQLTGMTVFNPDVYYFSEIPTDLQPWNVVILNLGAVAIAVFFSVLPALRAAWLHPVRALRYE